MVLKNSCYGLSLRWLCGKPTSKGCIQAICYENYAPEEPLQHQRHDAGGKSLSIIIETHASCIISSIRIVYLEKGSQMIIPELAIPKSCSKLLFCTAEAFSDGILQLFVLLDVASM